MSDNHTTGNPDYPSPKDYCHPQCAKADFWIVKNYEKITSLENIFENLEKYQFWKNVFFRWPDLTPRFDLNSTWNWPLIDPIIYFFFQFATFLDKNANFLKIPAIKMFLRNHDSALVTMSHVLWLYLGKKCWICKPESYFGSSVSHFDSLAILFWDELGREWELVKRGGWWRHHAASKRPSLRNKDPNGLKVTWPTIFDYWF